LDGSSLSEQVLPYVRQLAAGLSIPVTLISVVEPPPIGVAQGLNPQLHEHETDQLASRARSYLDPVANALRDAGIEITTAIPTGIPAQAIVDEAEKAPDTLIAMSGHGRSGVARWWLGSVADRVLHLTNNPMLIVRSHGPKALTHADRFDRVVVPVDGSELAEQVLTHVVPMACGLGLTVELVSVISARAEFRQMAVPEVYNPAYEDIAKQAEEDSSRYLAQLAASLRAQGVAAVEERLLHGDPTACIIDAASETPDRLVAMTTHGRSGIGRWVLGSVADRVVRNSGDPVLLVRAAAR
jgi:nucleotide-binding universal stress UspA family protein